MFAQEFDSPVIGNSFLLRPRLRIPTRPQCIAQVEENAAATCKSISRQKPTPE